LSVDVAAGCQKAVREHELFTYKIKVIAIVTVPPKSASQRRCCDQIKKTHLARRYFRLIRQGESEFNFDSEGKTLIVPAKFSHIVLRHAGEQCCRDF
jgi:hypothetical protein